MGDPAGVGPEVLLKSYKKARARQNLVAISDFDKIKSLAERYDVPLRKINHIDEAKNFKNQLNILSLNYPQDFYPGDFDVKKRYKISNISTRHTSKFRCYDKIVCLFWNSDRFN